MGSRTPTRPRGAALRPQPGRSLGPAPPPGRPAWPAPSSRVGKPGGMGAWRPVSSHRPPSGHSCKALSPSRRRQRSTFLALNRFFLKNPDLKRVLGRAEDEAEDGELLWTWGTARGPQPQPGPLPKGGGTELGSHTPRPGGSPALGLRSSGQWPLRLKSRVPPRITGGQCHRRLLCGAAVGHIQVLRRTRASPAPSGLRLRGSPCGSPSLTQMAALAA